MRPSARAGELAATAPDARSALLIALAAAAVTSSLAMGIRQTHGPPLPLPLPLPPPLLAEYGVAPWAFGLAVAPHKLV